MSQTIVNKLILGGAQLGGTYGLVSQKIGGVEETELYDMLCFLEEKGFAGVDTARTYSRGERVLNLANLSQTKIYTKLPPFSAMKGLQSEPANFVRHHLQMSLETLNRNCVHSLSLHGPEDLFDDRAKAVFDEIEKLRVSGLVEKIGVSCYEIDQVINQAKLRGLKFDYFQHPFNILDQRLSPSKAENLRKACGVEEIHARSALLQGLLAIYPKLPAKFVKWTRWFLRLESLASMYQCSVFELALLFVFSSQHIDKVIVGVDSLRQLRELVGALTNDELLARLEDLKAVEHFEAPAALVDPRMW